MIEGKSDYKAVEKIIAIGYPKNKPYLDELLEWTCDPNWPIAGRIYQYFVTLGINEVERVMMVARNADLSWRSSIILQIISSYDDEALKACTGWLKIYAREPASDGCDIEALRILAERKLITDMEIVEIARKNLYIYNMCIKETLDIAQGSINQFPYKEHTL